jgi:hypothetical protein
MKLQNLQLETNYPIWITSLFIFLFLLIYPFHRGLIYTPSVNYEGPIYGAIIFLSLVMVIFALLFFNKLTLKGPQGLFSLLILLIPLTFWISTLGAASKHNSMFMFYVYLIYAFLFILSIHLTNHPLGRKLIAGGIVLSGSVLVLFGFLNYFGDASLWGLIHYTSTSGEVQSTYPLAAEFGASGLRLTSVFQYSNTYAALLIGLFIAMISVVVTAKNRYVLILSSLMVIPTLLSILLTFSRGAYVVLPVVAILILILLRFNNQMLFILFSLVAAVAALFLYDPIFDIGTKAVNQFNPQSAFKGWALLLLSSGIYSVVCIYTKKYLAPLIQKFTDSRIRFKWSQMLLPVLCVVIGVLGAVLVLGNTGFAKMLPVSLEQRIESINFNQHSILERGTFYSDSFKVIKDYPFFGAGGGAWPALYQSYQNNPYVSKDAHSFYLQFLLETGVIGFLILSAILLIIVIGFIKTRINDSSNTSNSALIFWSIFIAIALHSAIDLDMSFVTIGAIFFISLGGLAANIKMKFSFDSLNKSITSKMKAIILLVISFFILFTSIQKLSAQEIYLKVKADTVSSDIKFSELDKQLRNAISKDPNNPVYLTDRANYLIQGYKQTNNQLYINEANKLIDRIKPLEPFNKGIYLTETDILDALGSKEEVLQLIESHLSTYPWDIQLYDKVYALHYELGKQAADQGDTESKQKHWEAITKLDIRLEEKINHLASLPEGQLQGKDFARTEQMAEILEQIK